jgi:hypothetical protein
LRSTSLHDREITLFSILIDDGRLTDTVTATDKYRVACISDDRQDIEHSFEVD